MVNTICSRSTGLTSLPEGLLAGLNQLIYLDLSGNRFHQVLHFYSNFLVLILKIFYTFSTLYLCKQQNLCKHLYFQEKENLQIAGQTKIFAQSAAHDFNIPMETLVLRRRYLQTSRWFLL